MKHMASERIGEVLRARESEERRRWTDRRPRRTVRGESGDPRSASARALDREGRARGLTVERRRRGGPQSHEAAASERRRRAGGPCELAMQTVLDAILDERVTVTDGAAHAEREERADSEARGEVEGEAGGGDLRAELLVSKRLERERREGGRGRTSTSSCSRDGSTTLASMMRVER